MDAPSVRQSGPFESERLRQTYPDKIIPGYYSDKRNWVSIFLDVELPREVVEKLVDDSYSLVFAKLTRKKQKRFWGIRSSRRTEVVDGGCERVPLFRLVIAGVCMSLGLQRNIIKSVDHDPGGGKKLSFGCSRSFGRFYRNPRYTAYWSTSMKIIKSKTIINPAVAADDFRMF